MAGEVQDVRIKFTTDTSGLRAAEGGLRALTATEREAVKDFQQMNQSSQAAFKSTTAGAQAAARSVGQLGNTAQTAGKQVDEVGKKSKGGFDAVSQGASGATSALSGLGGAILGAFALDSLSSAASKIIDITAEFQKYRAVLTNVLGSQESADIALQQIQQTAATTNFSVTELTDSYTKLVNSGFKPTQKEIMKLVDLANSSGKSIDQLTEAVIDAQTGEFERLKEFGIKTKKEGDNLTFTFKGVETQTKNTASAVQAYILGLGELKGVQGSTAAISQTLGGQISNLGDSFDQLFAAIGEGSGGALSYFVSVVGDAVQGITRFIKGSEQLRKEAELAAKGTAIEEVGSRVNDLTVRLGENAKLYENEQQARRAALNSEAQLLETARQRLSAEYGRLNEIFIAEKKRAAGANPLADVMSDTQVKIAQRNLAEVAKAYRINAAERQELGRLVDEEDKKELKNKEEILGLIPQLEKEIKDLTEAQKKSFSRNEIKQYQAEIERVQKELKALTDLTQKEDIEPFRFEMPELDPNEKIELPPVDTPKFKKSLEDAFLDFDLGEAIDPDRVKIKLDLINEEEERLAKARKDRMEKELKDIETYYDVQESLSNAFFELQDIKNQQREQQIAEGRARELKLVGDNEQAKVFIETKFDNQEKALRNRQARQERDKALFDIAISTAVAIAKTFAQFGVPAGIAPAAIAAAQGALQAAVVLARPLPKFRRGTKSVPGVDTGADSVFAMLRPGEGVMPTEKMKEYRASYDAMFDGRIPGKVINQFVMDYQRGNREPQVRVETGELVAEQRKTNKLLRSLKKQPVYDITLNKKGFETYLRRGDSVTQTLNNQFPQ